MSRETKLGGSESKESLGFGSVLEVLDSRAQKESGEGSLFGSMGFEGWVDFFTDLG